jgi:DNA polymerase-3 subunit delta'
MCRGGTDIVTWSEIYEHQSVVDAFRRAVSRGRLASSFLFVGPPGVGKRTFALKLAQALLCEKNPESQLEPCGDCWSCLHAAAGTHPDIETVQLLPDKNVLILEQFIGDLEHRNAEGLCRRIALKPVRGRRKIAIIDDADKLNPESSNSLLKTLEEPPPGSVIILLSTSVQRQLPTIRSRCQIIRFGSLTTATVKKLLFQRGGIDDPDEAAELAEMSEGSLQQAWDLADPELREFRGALLAGLAESPLSAVPLAKSILALCEGAGKEGAQKRRRLKQVGNWAVEFYRNTMCHSGSFAGESPSNTATLPHIDIETAADCLEICLDALQQVDANANLQTLIDAWMHRLAQRLS